MKYQGICLEGGGTAGIGHVGALRVLEQHNLLKDLKVFVGSSAGAILTAALACRASIDFIQKILWKTDFNEFCDDSWGIIADANRLIQHFGWYKGEELLNWIKKVLKELTGSDTITLKDVQQRYGSYLELTITDVNELQSQTIYVNPETHPTMQVATAVHRSALIPLFYKADCVHDGAIYHYYVDGGVMDNYPLWRLYRHFKPDECLGIKLISSSELKHQAPQHRNGLNLLEFSKLLIAMLRAQAMKSHVHKEDWARTIAVDVGKVSATDFDLDDSTKHFLIEQGEKAAKKHLKNK